MAFIKACLFDLDGVIVDTAKYHFLAWKRLADELNIKFTVEDNEKLKGLSRLDSLNMILEIGGLQLDESQKLILADKKNNWYVDYISKITAIEILPGVIEFLELLKQNNYKIALGSSSKNSMIILNNLGLTHYFDSIIDGTKVINAKPNPEVFLKCAHSLGVAPEECVVFEDGIAGITASKNANIFVIGIGSKDSLKDADLVIDGLDKMTLEMLSSLGHLTNIS